MNTYGNVQRLDPATYDSKDIVTIGKKLWLANNAVQLCKRIPGIH
jgi:hypothetical protein